jgi:hypothetical protein
MNIAICLRRKKSRKMESLAVVYCGPVPLASTARRCRFWQVERKISNAEGIDKEKLRHWVVPAHWSFDCLIFAFSTEKHGKTILGKAIEKLCLIFLS